MISQLLKILLAHPLGKIDVSVIFFLYVPAILMLIGMGQTDVLHAPLQHELQAIFTSD